jgi:16S rRNA (guanine527-N7)-methyltransferase
LRSEPQRSAGEQARIETYLEHVRRWGRAINLTGAIDAASLRETLVEPVLGFPAALEGETLIDVGSGNGSPGLVLAAIRPDRPTALLEPRAKRWAFLRDAARAMGLSRVEVSRARHDAYGGPAADTVTVRAVGLSPEELRHLVRPGGQLLIFGGDAPAGAETLRNERGDRVHRVVFHVKHD